MPSSTPLIDPGASAEVLRGATTLEASVQVEFPSDLPPFVGADEPFVRITDRMQRPVERLLPEIQKFSHQKNFDGMTEAAVPLEELHVARARLIETLIDDMPREHREFLVGFKKGEPDWDKLGVVGAADLPAVKFKQMNLEKLGEKTRGALATKLVEILGLKEK